MILWRAQLPEEHWPEEAKKQYAIFEECAKERFDDRMLFAQGAPILWENMRAQEQTRYRMTEAYRKFEEAILAEWPDASGQGNDVMIYRREER